MTSFKNFNGLKLFLVANALLVAIVTAVFLQRLDSSKVPEENVLGAQAAEPFIKPLAFVTDQKSFVQLAHAPSNTKVSIFMIPRSESEIPKNFLERLRKYTPDSQAPIDPDLLEFIKAQFDTRRTDLIEEVTVEKTNWKRVIVKNKSHYLLSLFELGEGQAAVVAFNPREAVPVKVIKDLFGMFPLFNKAIGS